MDGFKNMSLGEVIDEVAHRIENHLVDLGYEIEYPGRPLTATLLVLDKARDYGQGDQIVGFAVASSFLTCLVNAYKVQLPEELSDRLHGRITSA
jgi:hypothetical protein